MCFVWKCRQLFFTCSFLFKFGDIFFRKKFICPKERKAYLLVLLRRSWVFVCPAGTKFISEVMSDSGTDILCESLQQCQENKSPENYYYFIRLFHVWRNHATCQSCWTCNVVKYNSLWRYGKMPLSRGCARLRTRRRLYFLGSWACQTALFGCNF